MCFHKPQHKFFVHSFVLLPECLQASLVPADNACEGHSSLYFKISGEQILLKYGNVLSNNAPEYSVPAFRTFSSFEAEVLRTQFGWYLSPQHVL